MSLFIRSLLLAALVLSAYACSDRHDSPAVADPISLPAPEPVTPAAQPASFGPFAVGREQFQVIDTSREDRPIEADVWYPVDDQDAVSEPLSVYLLLGGGGIDAEIAVDNLRVSSAAKRPLIIFSHGAGGINTQSTPLMETLASHGFIVVSPAHMDNASDENPAANRVPDISFIIDTMLARNEDSMDAFYDRIDPEVIGVTGHSVGGATAIGMIVGMGGAPADPRVDAIAPISAAVASTFSEQQLANIDVPMLLLGGTLDTAVPISLNDMVFDSVDALGQTFNVAIEGATHTHFAAICAFSDFLLDLGFTVEQWPSLGAAALIGPYNDTCSEDAFPIEEAVRLQNIYIVSFFKAFLLDDARYLEYLSDEYAASEPAIIFEAK